MKLTISYAIAPRTNGANPFAIFEQLNHLNQEALRKQIRLLSYSDFLATAYWFSVSSVAKSKSGMRCQVCNSSLDISVHHRTYDTHGMEHAHMVDLVVLCDNCHGLFHGHRTLAFVPDTRKGAHGNHKEQQPHPDVESDMPDCDPVILDRSLIDRCRANGSFTNATLNAFGLIKSEVGHGWVQRIVGKAITREQYRLALLGKFVYREKLNRNH
jgi:hypothetical protein